MDRPHMTIVRRGEFLDRKGWCFEVWYCEKGAQIVSALFKTKKEAGAELQRYLTTGNFCFYGSAEK